MGRGIKTKSLLKQRIFLTAIEAGESKWPDFNEGLAVNRVIAATLQSSRERTWVELADF